MKISTNSWHFKLNVLIDNSSSVWRKKNLCSYFWFTVRNLLLALSGIFFLGFALLLPWIMGFGILKHFLDFHSDKLAVTLSLSALIGYSCFSIFFLLSFGFFTLKDKISDKLETSPSSKPNIMIEYLKAKKQKICPLIEFEDKE